MKKLGYAVLLLAAVSCQKPEGEITMKPGETISNKEVSLKFVDFEDSRCPTGANCFWEGETVAYLSFDVAGTVHEFSMGDHRVIDTVVAGYQLKYLGLTPYPTSEVIKASKKRLIIELNKL